MTPALGFQCKPYREGLGAAWLLTHRDLWKSFLSLLMSHVKKRIFLAQASPLPAPLLAGTSFPLPLLPPPFSEDYIPGSTVQSMRLFLSKAGALTLCYSLSL